MNAKNSSTLDSLLNPKIRLCMRLFAWLVPASLTTMSTTAQTLYQVTNLGAGVLPLAISEQGQVVGLVNDGQSYAQPFTYQNGQLTILTLTGLNGYNIPSAVTSSGIIGGNGHPSGNQPPAYGFIYQNGQTTVLINGVGNTSLGGINSSGAATGTYTVGLGNSGQTVSQPFIYSNGQLTGLGNYGESFATVGLGINNDRVIVGYTSDPNTANGLHAFRYSDNSFTLLPNLPGGTQSYASGINDAGLIVGQAFSSGNRAVEWFNGVPIELGTLGGSDAYVDGLNNSGLIVGRSQITNASFAAFVYINGSMRDLNKLLASPISTTLTEARGVNDHGQIIAMAANGDGYLLTPYTVPEPGVCTTVITILMGGFGVARRIRRNWIK